MNKNCNIKANKVLKTLSEHDSKKFLAEYGIPVTRERVVAVENDAVVAAGKIGYPVALKGSGEAITHKTEMDLIALDLRDEKEVRAAYQGLTSTNGGSIRQVLVQQMIMGGREIAVGMIRDPQFGPCVMFGIGGIFTEILKDTAFRIAPLSRKDALDMMDEIRSSKILDTFRGKSAIDRVILADILVSLGEIGLNRNEISEIDINPLKFVDGKPVAVDALVVSADEPNAKSALVENIRFGEGFPPKSIGIVGVSRSSTTAVPGYTGVRIFRLLKEYGFLGTVYPINPKAKEIDGVKVYPDVASVPEPLDLVIITVSAGIVPSVVEDCVAAKARNVHICTSGFSETGQVKGIKLENEIRDIAVKNGLSIIGPNCMGFHVPSANIKMFDEMEDFQQGPVAFISQSGGHAQTFMFQAPEYDIGISKIISYGNALILDADDFLAYLATDPETQIICAYIEGVKNARGFFEQAMKITPEKPVIILKGGLTDSGARAAASHTGAMAGDKQIWNAFFKQTGAIAVHSLDEMAEITYCFLKLDPLSRLQAAVLGVGGGATVSTGDICSSEGVTIPAFSQQTVSKLNEFIPLVNQGIANPMDIPAVIFDSGGLSKTLELLNNDPEIDIIIINIPSRVFSAIMGGFLTGFKEGLNNHTQNHPGAKPIVVTLTEGVHLSMTEKAVRELRKSGIIAFTSLAGGSRALRRFVDYHKFLMAS